MKSLLGFVACAVLLAALSWVPSGSTSEGKPTTPHVLLRSSWQTVNIGDIAHSPGVLTLLGQHIPQAKVTLWTGKLDRGVEDMIQRDFPKVKIVSGDISPGGKATNANLQAAFDQADFFLHGSGPSLVAAKHLAAWKQHTKKPYGIYGITLSQVTDETRPLYDNARFLFLRDSLSLKFAKSKGLKPAVMEFGPDGAFAVKLRNDEKALAFLKANGLEEGKFLCAIPRFRYTPYWKIRQKAMTDEDRKRDAYNQKMKEIDHKKVRDAIIAFVRKTGMKVLVCPEDVSHVEIGKEMLVDPLPPDVKAKVVWRDSYWITDEAVSVYVRSIGLLSMDMHSPIMAVGNGIPAVFCYFKEQTSKPEMWRDIGLGDWLFDLDEQPDGTKITQAVLAIAENREAAQAKVANAMKFVNTRQQQTMALLAAELGVKAALR